MLARRPLPTRKPRPLPRRQITADRPVQRRDRRRRLPLAPGRASGQLAMHRRDVPLPQPQQSPDLISNREPPGIRGPLPRCPGRSLVLLSGRQPPPHCTKLRQRHPSCNNAPGQRYPAVLSRQGQWPHTPSTTTDQQQHPQARCHSPTVPKPGDRTRTPSPGATSSTPTSCKRCGNWAWTGQGRSRSPGWPRTASDDSQRRVRVPGVSRPTGVGNLPALYAWM
jgi:hypothetical protein